MRKEKKKYNEGFKHGVSRGFLEKKAESGDSLAEFGLMVDDAGKSFGKISDGIEGKKEDEEEKNTLEAGLKKGKEKGIKAAEEDEKELKDRAYEIF